MDEEKQTLCEYPTAETYLKLANDLTRQAFDNVLAAAKERCAKLEAENRQLKAELEQIRSKLSRPKAKGHARGTPLKNNKRTVIPPGSES